MLKRLIIAIHVGIQAYRQLPKSRNAYQVSCDTGEGWCESEFPDGFIDLGAHMDYDFKQGVIYR